MCESCPATGRRRTSPPVARLAARPHELVAGRVARHRRAEDPSAEDRQWVGETEQRVDGRPHEKLEADERGDRVARQVEEQVVAAHAERDGLAGLHGDAPEHLLDPQLGLHPPHEIVRADRRAAGRDEHVEPEQSLFHRATMLLLGVRNGAELGRHGAGGEELRGEHEAVRLVDLAGAERLPWLHELRAGDEDPDPRPLRAAHFADPGRGERPHLCRAERGAGLEQQRPGRDVPASPAHVRARP